MQIDCQRFLRLRRDAQLGLPVLCPILPPEISHQRELRCELIQPAGHELRRVGLPEVDLGAEQPALLESEPEARGEICDEWMKPNLKSTGAS